MDKYISYFFFFNFILFLFFLFSKFTFYKLNLQPKPVYLNQNKISNELNTFNPVHILNICVLFLIFSGISYFLFFYYLPNNKYKINLNKFVDFFLETLNYIVTYILVICFSGSIFWFVYKFNLISEEKIIQKIQNTLITDQQNKNMNALLKETNTLKKITTINFNLEDPSLRLNDLSDTTKMYLGLNPDKLLKMQYLENGKLLLTMLDFTQKLSQIEKNNTIQKIKFTFEDVLIQFVKQLKVFKTNINAEKILDQVDLKFENAKQNYTLENIVNNQEYLLYQEIINKIKSTPNFKINSLTPVQVKLLYKFGKIKINNKIQPLSQNSNLNKNILEQIVINTRIFSDLQHKDNFISKFDVKDIALLFIVDNNLFVYDLSVKYLEVIFSKIDPNNLNTDEITQFIELLRVINFFILKYIALKPFKGELYLQLKKYLIYNLGKCL